MTVTMDDVSVGCLEDNAAKRKERLAALKRKLQGQNQDGADSSNKGDQDDESLPTPIFRSYKPLAPELQENAFNTADPSLIEDKIQVFLFLMFKLFWDVLSMQDSLAAAEETTMIDELDIVNLAPRKPDWDLKRDVAPKLDKLERRTQKAIAELIRERLKEEDLANAVTAGASFEQRIAQDDD